MLRKGNIAKKPLRGKKGKSLKPGKKLEKKTALNAMDVILPRLPV